MISSRDMISFARDALELPESVSVTLSPLQGRGSDRTYFRLRIDLHGHARDTSLETRSAILVHYDPKRIENTYYVDIAEFLREIHVPVPRMMRHDRAQCLIVMEDLGDRDLWSFREAPWETRRALYRKTLATVHRLHSFPEKEFPSNRVRLMEGFGPELYRWERDYFRDHFVRGVCGIGLEPSMERELETELAALAERLMGTGCSLVHRDLQSQNVMIRDDEPVLIDFQGMRFGSLFYDLGSLLCDPYVNLSDEERDELLSSYYALSKQALDWDAFRNCFWEASAQRLMQALGAYGFLGLNKGLKAFLGHISPGLRNLSQAATRVPSLPGLRELCHTCQSVIEKKVS
jgi:aminoglycoside/choline kinase family phosphotransferase